MTVQTRREVLVNTVAVFAATVVGPEKFTLAIASETSPIIHTVEIRKFKFVPNTLSVKPGDTITWINRDIAPHTATAINKTWDTGTLKKGEMKSLVVTDAWSSIYYCRFHKMMKAAIELNTEE